jgi:tryptophanyl-tRNA synthetase
MDSSNTGSSPAKKRRLMSGMRATGDLHIGHYFGALKNWLALQSEHECYFGVMDWHGLTTAYKTPQQVSQWRRHLVAEFLAWGIDPDQSVLFIQSEVPEHLELFFILANLTPMGWLERVPTWKDAEEEAKATDTHNLGRFAYPVLQAADIALYKGVLVPVGQDQVAHLELTREIIRRFNKIYKLKVPEPRPLLTETPLLPGLDGRKMSKSYGNVLGLSEEFASLKKKIMTMPTDPNRVRRQDPGDPKQCHVYSYHQVFSTPSDLTWVEKGCVSADIGCADCKGCLLDKIEAFIAPARQKKQDLLMDSTHLDSLIKKGTLKAREEASRNLKEIKKTMGLGIS